MKEQPFQPPNAAKVPVAEGRHPATQQILRWFVYGHLPEHLQAVSAECQELAEWMVNELPDGPELTTGLRKLLEAKDCFVRASLSGGQG